MILRNIVGLFFLLHQSWFSKAEKRSVKFKEAPNKLMLGEDSTAGISVQGVVDCARLSSSQGESGFVYNDTTERCMPFSGPASSPNKVSSVYWMNTKGNVLKTKKNNNKQTSKFRRM